MKKTRIDRSRGVQAMNRTIFLTTWILLLGFSFVVAQEGDKPKKKEDPIQKLKEIQKLMEKIESDLARAGFTRGAVDEEAVRKKIEELMKAGDDQKTATRKVRELFRRSGLNEEETIREIERIMKSGQKSEEVGRKLKKLFESGRKQGQAIQKINKIFEESQGRQEKVLGDIDRLIKMAKRQKSSGSGSGQKPEKEKPGKEEKDKKTAKNPDQSGKEESEKPAKKPYDPPKNNVKHEGRPKSDDNERWGNLAGTVHELIMSASRKGNLPKYGRLAELYSKILSEMYGEEEEDR